MLPYLAQGANSSLEDGAVLGGLLGHLRHKSQLPQILKLYESLRKNRGEAIVRETFKQRHDFHLPDGEQQEKRDALFKSQLGKEEIDPDTAFPSRWTCPKVQPWLYGYDAVREVENAVKANPDIFGDSGYKKDVNVEGQKLWSWAGLSSYLPFYLPILLFGVGKFVF
jgi:salicylate hydroxylase